MPITLCVFMVSMAYSHGGRSRCHELQQWNYIAAAAVSLLVVLLQPMLLHAVSKRRRLVLWLLFATVALAGFVLGWLFYGASLVYSTSYSNQSCTGVFFKFTWWVVTWLLTLASMAVLLGCCVSCCSAFLLGPPPSDKGACDAC
jgi:hypothetical protein